MLSDYLRSQRHDNCGVVVVQHSRPPGRARDEIATKVSRRLWIGGKNVALPHSNKNKGGYLRRGLPYVASLTW